jgi:subtilisin
MRRRISLLVLAALLALPVVSPASAASPVAPATDVAASEPSVSAEPDPTDAAEPTGEPEASAPAEPEASPPADPTPTPSSSATPEPVLTDPAPSPSPTIEPDPSAAPVATEQPSPSPEPVPTAPGGTADDVVPVDADGRPDTTGRYLVILRSESTTKAVVERQRVRTGLRAERTFSRAFKGFAARLDRTQRLALADDPSVLAVVPDEVVELASQTIPTGVSRVGARKSTVAGINGVDVRVNADVAIVDTGIQPDHPDLNVVGGYNCSTTNRGAWRDVEGHGTHVAGTVGALDNSIGAVGVAPGVRLYAVKILNDEGFGLLSWYACGLDWILAQRDPKDSTRPLFESVNMSVAKSGFDDRNCGHTNKDVLHQAICRIVAGGIPVVVAAGNSKAASSSYIPAAYDEVITVSALADTDGKAGGLGGPRCWSWGGYDSDDTFADFSNYGYDVDIIAPGKCIWSTLPGGRYGYSSGTSMATPAVAGALALYKASRPKATPADVKTALRYVGTNDWKTWTDPDATHEKLLDVSRIGPLGSFTLSAGAQAPLGETGGTVTVPIALGRSATFFERVGLGLANVPAGWTARLDRTFLMGWDAKSAAVTVTVPTGTRAGRYELTVVGTNLGRTVTGIVPVVVENDDPVALPPKAGLEGVGAVDGSSVRVRLAWPAATDATSPIAAYELQASRAGATWGGTRAFSSSLRTTTWAVDLGVAYRFRVRARDTVGNWGEWAESAQPFVAEHVNDRSTKIAYTGTWAKTMTTRGTAGTITSTTRTGAKAKITFTGYGALVVAPTSPLRGRAYVYVDGVYARTVLLWSKDFKARRIVFTATFPNGGTHSIEFRNAGTAGKPLVSLDAFVILR